MAAEIAKLTSKQALKSFSRLGGTARRVRHGVLVRIPCTSRDGRACVVTIQIDDHRSQPLKAALRDWAARLRVSPGDLVRVLDEWTPAQMADHLAQFTAEELRPPAHRHGR